MTYGNIFKLEMNEGLGVVTFDVPGESVNTWTEEALQEFFGLFDHLETRNDLEGVVFVSGKANNFHSGANLRMMEQINSRERLSQMLDKTHEAFQHLENAPFPSVAAIKGHCLGGGFEFALACTARLAQESKTTLLGLPETLVGLLPGGGGTQRLSRLIGPPALELIVRGKTLPASRAMDKGLADKLIEEDKNLTDEALLFLRDIVNNKSELKRPQHDFSQIDALASEARKQFLKSTRGRELPGPLKAIEAVREGVKLPLTEGLEVEKNYFIEVALSKESKGSIHTFFLKTATDRPSNMVSPNYKPQTFQKIAVLGFGTMGRGIVIDLLQNLQVPVVVKDEPEALEKGKAFVEKTLQKIASKKQWITPVEEMMQRLLPITEFSEDLKEADLVIEAVYEDLKVKHEVLQEVSSLVREDCLIASNTSTISIDKMAPAVKNPERFAGAHFFSPVWKMELLEVVKGSQTAPETLDALLDFAGKIKKRPVKCNDNPGFVVNALLLPYFMNMYELLKQGISIERIDASMVKFGFPVGPVRLIDEIGLDVQYHSFFAMGLEPPYILKRVIDEGRYGLKKSGKGFFLEDGSVDPEVLPLLQAQEEQVHMSEEDIQYSLYEPMVEKGKELLEKGIVDDPQAIDVAMIWGAGFPPEKGGPMKWADLTGLSKKINQKNFY